MKIVLSNAPPSAGKDTFAQWIFGQDNPFSGYQMHFERFSRPHKEAFAAMTGSKIDRFYNVEYYEDHKNDVIPWLGVSYRQWQIDFSEKYMKPLYGKDIFTRMFYVRTLKIERDAIMASDLDEPRSENIFILSDCGFDVELQALLDYGVPAQDILLARIHRPGCTYKGDSRSYIYHKDILSFDINNDKTIDTYGNKMKTAISQWLYDEMKNVPLKEGDASRLERRIQQNGG